MTSDRDDDPRTSGDVTRDAAKGTDEEATLRLLAEEVRVAKERVETGRVHVSTHTHEREARVDEDLARERVEITTIPIGRRIDAVPEVRQEGDTTIVPVVEEVLVVERQLLLKEEVRITRVRTTERYQETVTLRHQEAVVTRAQGDARKADASSISGSAQTRTDKPTGE